MTVSETFGFPLSMIRNARKILGFLMVAVALCANSLHGYSGVLAAFDSHTHGPAGSHMHHADSFEANGISFEASQVDRQLVQDVSGTCVGASCDEPATADHCAYLHTHCCSSMALSAGDCNLKLSYLSRMVAPERAAYIPLGQLSNPLFRPPRASL